MSDNARTTIAFSVIRQSVDSAVTTLAEALDRQGDSLLVPDPAAAPTARILFRPIVEAATKYQEPEGIERDEPEPEDLLTLAKLTAKYRNVSIHTSFDFAGQSYLGTVYVYDVRLPDDTSNAGSAFVRLSIHSYLTFALRGAREFGGPVKIDAEIKSDVIQLALRLAVVLGADAFVYGLEGDRPSPFTPRQIEAYLRAPERHPPPLNPYLAGIKSSLLSRDELLRVWQDEPVVKMTTAGFVLLDLLQDSDGWVTDEELGEDEEELDQAQ